jgi:3-hydroxymyristoyl/3-hydroxydecanoyl-(acyl carrier protein) dehydratase
VDRVLDIQPVGDLTNLAFDSSKVGVKVQALKSVSYNEPFFQGHFPQFSIMPGVLIIEAMAQASSFSIYPYIEHDVERISRDFQCILVGVDGVRFRKPVVPGDALHIETEVVKCRGKLWSFKCQGIVDGQRVAEAEILANLMLKTEGL